MEIEQVTALVSPCITLTLAFIPPDDWASIPVSK
jgi:hypothetical protein